MSELPPNHEDHPLVVSRNARRGLFLFSIYFAIFILFVLLNIFAPEMMARPSLGGPNLAVDYGIGLIFAAIALALVYMRLTSKSG
jgi:uncharacterized membrane protein (DUF485 family)